MLKHERFKWQEIICLGDSADNISFAGRDCYEITIFFSSSQLHVTESSCWIFVQTISWAGLNLSLPEPMMKSRKVGPTFAAVG